MKPPAIGNMVVTSPMLCIRAQTENPALVSTSSVLCRVPQPTNYAKSQKSTQWTRQEQSVAKSIETACSNDTGKRDQGYMSAQETSSESIFNDYAIASLGGFFRIENLLLIRKNLFRFCDWWSSLCVVFMRHCEVDIMLNVSSCGLRCSKKMLVAPMAIRPINGFLSFAMTKLAGILAIVYLFDKVDNAFGPGP